MDGIDGNTRRSLREVGRKTLSHEMRVDLCSIGSLNGIAAAWPLVFLAQFTIKYQIVSK